MAHADYRIGHAARIYRPFISLPRARRSFNMRTISRFALAVVALGCTRPATALDRAQDARRHLGTCAGNELAFDGMPCEETADEFIIDYQLAFRGDYTAQRNLAYCFSGKCRPAV